jgi:hypothetical protein
VQGGIKILLALLATGGMVTVMLIARKEGKSQSDSESKSIRTSLTSLVLLLNLPI